MEQGEARPPVRPHSATASPAVISDELVDEITRRVVERLAPATARELVKQIVGDVAERLVREEITHQSGGEHQAITDIVD